MRSMITSYFFGSSIRIPPICTNSAVTSGTFMELIFSTTAGGKVFSIPNNRPIFFIAHSVETLLCNVSLTTVSDSQGDVASYVSTMWLKIFFGHPQPQRPVMLGVVIPNVEPVGDGLVVQHRRKPDVLVQTDVPGG